MKTLMLSWDYLGLPKSLYMLANRLFSAIKPFFTDSVMLDCIIQS